MIIFYKWSVNKTPFCHQPLSCCIIISLHLLMFYSLLWGCILFHFNINMLDMFFFLSFFKKKMKSWIQAFFLLFFLFCQQVSDCIHSSCVMLNQFSLIEKIDVIITATSVISFTISSDVNQANCTIKPYLKLPCQKVLNWVTWFMKNVYFI